MQIAGKALCLLFESGRVGCILPFKLSHGSKDGMATGEQLQRGTCSKA
jgi:hypothetical protein